MDAPRSLPQGVLVSLCWTICRNSVAMANVCASPPWGATRTPGKPVERTRPQGTAPPPGLLTTLLTTTLTANRFAHGHVKASGHS